MPMPSGERLDSAGREIDVDGVPVSHLIAKLEEVLGEVRSEPDTTEFEYDGLTTSLTVADLRQIYGALVVLADEVRSLTAARGVQVPQ